MSTDPSPPGDRTEAPRFMVVDEHEADGGIGRGAFLRAVGGRLSLELLGFGLAAVAGSQILGRLAYIRPRAWSWGPQHWKVSLLFDVLVATAVLLSVQVADEAVARGARRWRAYVVAVVCGCAIAALMRRWVEAWTGWEEGMIWQGHAPPDWLGRFGPLLVFMNALLYSLLACSVYVNLRTARLASMRMHEAEVARAQARRRTLESRLQAMQARVEPQFLFNTLAQARELTNHDPALAGRMLDDLINYLRAALPHLRESSSTLGQELALARAYLDIMRVRLGDRLEFSIDVAARHADVRMPPMMLLPLIDHALTYGLQPGARDGSIRISTRVGNGRVRLEIDDSGAAFVPGGNAEAFDNIAQRLDALYGAQAHLDLESAPGLGTRAILEMPHEDAHGHRR